MNEFFIRDGNVDDARAIYEICKESFDDPWTIGVIKESIIKNRVYILENFKEIVGYAFVSRFFSELSIDNIAIKKEYRGKKLSKELMNRIILNYPEDEMTLEVRINNKEAIKLYKSFDFKEEGVRKNYYKGNIDALIMWRR